MVQKPHLRPKKITSSDKKIAEKMKRIFLRRLAEAQEIPFTETILEEMLQDPDLRESIALCTYAANLLQRLESLFTGPRVASQWTNPTSLPEL